MWTKNSTATQNAIQIKSILALNNFKGANSTIKLATVIRLIKNKKIPAPRPNTFIVKIQDSISKMNPAIFEADWCCTNLFSKPNRLGASIFLDVVYSK
ncbi:hypothetical protein BN863_25350 [Formosa agariphila KMM 3901]|uniref:Uncharacterized protein n=1 Tax=Formosa agariphila (strain DSM 15362 / KCTC 12365 / LMG 23005 / KMM 3901 / M-2Alg 35-1) TaxID=1347342 RepID=T2KMW5_FORAG|nr:hypothetical protein BN863_25350 [Formosa agariphila KMM 3901]